MTDELTKAAKECQASVNLGNVSIESRNAIVRFALPLLDGTPIDEEWLRGLGFTEYQDIRGIAFETLPGLYLSWIDDPTEGTLRLDGLIWMEGTTRGSLRMLARSLGIDLREPENRK